jgi:capping protein alpha
MIQINVHFFEQGNVQLATEYAPTITLPESLSDRSSAEDIAKVAMKIIAKTEEEYQLELNESYRDMADRTFRNLRRVLPVSGTAYSVNNYA